MEDSDKQTDPSQPIINTKKSKKNNVDQRDQKRQKQNKKHIAAEHIELLLKYFNNLPEQYLNQELESNEARLTFVKTYISPLNNMHVDTYTAIIRQSIIKQYQSPLEGQLNQSKIKQSILVFMQIMKMYRSCSVPYPILITTYNQFEKLWQSNLFKDYQNDLIELWKYIPFSLLKHFLNKFDLRKQFQSLDFHMFIKDLTNSLFQGKLQQSYEYYRVFKNNRTLTALESEKMSQFQDKQLIPRITKKDQLFTNTVISILKEDQTIAQKVFSCIQLKEYQNLVRLTSKDIYKHPRLLKEAMKKHYYDIARRAPAWFVIEDKISYSPIYIDWLCKDILKKFQTKKQKSKKMTESQQSDNQSSLSSKTFTNIQNYQEALLVCQSILKRSGKNVQIKQYIPNPLFEKDRFMPAALILQQLEISQKNLKEDDFYLIKEEKLVFVKKVDEIFQKAKQHLLKSKLVGFDTEFWPTTSKYEEGGVSIIQLATPQIYYIFDYRNMKDQPRFNEFLMEFMKNQSIFKVGHTVSSDLTFLHKTVKQPIQPKGMIDLTTLYKTYFPNEIYSSLKFMCQKFLGKKLCKYEQRSNWARRPLKKTQLYYAALDAYICLQIYQKISKIADNLQGRQKRQVEMTKQGKQKTKSENKGIQYVFDFQKYQDFVQRPIFVIDNMLKKLCSIMRNCGLDAEYIAIKDYELAIAQSKKEKRIIVTRDSQLAQRYYTQVPIFLLKEGSSSERMFEQLIAAFNLDLTQYQTLSRCVKCNNSEVVIISKEEAEQQINFAYKDNQIQVYWRCTKCRQIYWEGGQYKKAMNKYNSLKN